MRGIQNRARRRYALYGRWHPGRYCAEPARRAVADECRPDFGNALGWAAKGLGERIGEMLRTAAQAKELRVFLKKIYSSREGESVEIVDQFSDAEVLELAQNLQEGVPFATPVF